MKTICIQEEREKLSAVFEGVGYWNNVTEKWHLPLVNLQSRDISKILLTPVHSYVLTLSHSRS